MKRKNKSWLSASAMLAIMSLGGISVVTNASTALKTSNPATNLIEAQEKQTEQAKDSQSKAGQMTGGLSASVSSSNLDKAVKAAKKAGLKVNQEKTQDLGVVSSDKVETTQQSIIDDYAKQAQAIDVATSQYSSDMTAYNQAKEKMKADETELKATAETAKQAGLDVQQGTNLKGKTFDEIAQYDKDKIAEIKASTADYQAKLDAYNKAVEEMTNKWGTEGYPQNFISNELNLPGTDSKGATQGAGGNATVTVKGSGSADGTYKAGTTGGDYASYGYAFSASNFKGTMTLTYNGLKDCYYGNTKIAGVRVTVTPANDYTKSNGTFAARTNPLVLGGTGSFLETTTTYGQNIPNTISYDLTYTLVDDKGSDITLKANTAGLKEDSIDQMFSGSNMKHNEFVKLDSSMTVNPIVGSILEQQADGSWYCKDPNKEGANQIGGIATQLYFYNNKDVTTFKWTNGFIQSETENEVNGFGLCSEDVLPPKPVAPEITYSLADVPTEPETPTVAYHYSTLSVQPKVEKEQFDDKQVELKNGVIVPKNSQGNYDLNVDDNLPSGRENTTSLVFTDPLSTGYDFDEKATQKANPNYDVKFDSATHTVTFTATADYLAQLNADLTKTITVQAPQVKGNFDNDGGKYSNNFELSINGKYIAYSNVVDVKTPGDDPEKPIQPTKKDTDDKGNDINGHEVNAGTTLHYQLLWNLENYKDVVASEDEIDKGFFFVDDYSEGLTPKGGETFRDAKGKAVKGIKVTNYESVSKAPERVQEALKSAGISPKGAFQFYDVTDPIAFYNTYVKTGTNITIETPMEVNKDFSGTVTNSAYQIDFGNGYYSNTVKNEVPKAPTPTPETPKTPKSVLPHTGEEKTLWSLAGVGILLVALAVAQRDKLKVLVAKLKNSWFNS
jgi:Glucose dehydrogenase